MKNKNKNKCLISLKKNYKKIKLMSYFIKNVKIKKVVKRENNS